MRKLLVLLLISATASLSFGCMATRKFTRNEVKTASDQLNARIDTTDGQIKETRDSVDRVNQRVTSVDGRVTGVDGRVTDLDSRTTQGFNGLKGDVQNVDQKAAQAQNAASRAAGDVVILDQKFQNRNQFTVAGEKTIQFKFDSAQLDPKYMAVLDEVAGMLEQNADSIVVLQGRTDSVGDKDYNVKLGDRRVESVRRYLAVEKSVQVYKIHQISMGAARPVASNDSRDGREKNRAVTMTILVPKLDGSVAAK
ncbi:MAG TPA: OmpA family protein [Terriglobia bacterium]|nr:OmpA family protein [Terriglobia bacterium]